MPPRSGVLTRFRPHRLSRQVAIAAATLGTAFAGSNIALAQIDSQNRSLQEIVVQGEKTARNLQDTPTSVRVVTNDDIMAENINGFYDVLERTANVTATDFGFNIRGIDAFSVSGGGNSYLTSVYSDGAVLPYRAIQQGGFSTWDVQQVEVLRGPQSTLQGRNALAGAIVMNTIDPTWDWDSRGRLGIGEDGKQEIAAAFGGAIVEDQLAFRISAEDREFDGVFPNTTRGDYSDFEEDQTIRAKLLFEPDALPDLSAMLTLTRSENDVGVTWINNVPGEDPFDNPHTEFNDPTHEFTEMDMAVLSIDYALGEHWSLTSNTAWSDVSYGYEWDGDSTAEPLNTLIDDRQDDTLTQEFLFNFDYGKVSGVIGTYFFNLDVEDNYSGVRHITFADLGVRQALTAPPPAGFGLPNPVADQVLAIYAPFNPVSIDNSGITRQEVNSKAIFADFTWSVTDKLDLFAGLRYDHEEQANEANSTVEIVNIEDMPDPADYAANPLLAQIITQGNAFFFAQAASASGSEPLVDADFSATLPKIGATWHWTSDISTSFTYQEGYRSGGVGSNIARNTTYTYDPEYTDNYELSFRSMWLDGRLTANANLFYLDWQDQQVNVQLSGNRYDTETVNSGRSEVKGLELELFFQANRNWSGYAAWGYSHTEFTDFVIEQGATTYDLTGRSFGSAPETTFNAGLTYRGDTGLFANLNANYQDAAKNLNNPYSNGQVEGDPGFDPENDARTLVNLRAGYEWENLGLYLTVENLLDEDYVVRPNTAGYSLTIGKPRLATLRLEADF